MGAVEANRKRNKVRKNCFLLLHARKYMKIKNWKRNKAETNPKQSEELCVSYCKQKRKTKRKQTQISVLDILKSLETLENGLEEQSQRRFCEARVSGLLTAPASFRRSGELKWCHLPKGTRMMQSREAKVMVAPGFSPASGALKTRVPLSRKTKVKGKKTETRPEAENKGSLFFQNGTEEVIDNKTLHKKQTGNKPENGRRLELSY